jgi:hypothetical protein
LTTRCRMRQISNVLSEKLEKTRRLKERAPAQNEIGLGLQLEVLPKAGTRGSAVGLRVPIWAPTPQAVQLEVSNMNMTTMMTLPLARDCTGSLCNCHGQTLPLALAVG